ncbi:nucleoside 2-deoxyribosyltransferase [Ornithinibacillus xuwenensis]|uniref:Nucleoside 2-deoxyribosyltransferase n=1 Tax=Ornithinibacillus xuwenensis TaxID=3144668 RepID=A0ABU9XF03_9BACI
MKFYIASGFDNQAAVHYVRDQLILAGHSHTYDWTKNNRATTEEALRTIGEAEKAAVADSDVFIVLLPGGKGTHTELGIALGLNKKIFIYSKEKIDVTTATTFYYVHGVEHFYGNLAEFVTTLVDSTR